MSENATKTRYKSLSIECYEKGRKLVTRAFEGIVVNNLCIISRTQYYKFKAIVLTTFATFPEYNSKNLSTCQRFCTKYSWIILEENSRS